MKRRERQRREQCVLLDTGVFSMRGKAYEEEKDSHDVPTGYIRILTVHRQVYRHIYACRDVQKEFRCTQ